MKVPSLKDLLIILTVAILGTGFFAGILLAFSTGQGLWLLLSVFCWIILGAG